MSMEHKSFPAIVTKVEADQGIVEQIVAVFGNLDEGKDIIHAGAFTKSLAERGQKIRVLDQHNTDSIMRVIGKPLGVKEIGRSDLPAELVRKFPDATGGLWTRTQYLMDTPEGKGAFLRIKAGAVDEASIGYDALDMDYSKVMKNGQQVTARNLRTCRLWEYSPVIWGLNQATTTISVKANGDALAVKGVIPFKATEKAPEGEPWSRPALQDFADKGWGDLTDAEKRAIAAHYAWSDNMPPETFGDLKLPHHRPSDGAVVWMGVANCMARMNQTQGIDMPAVRNHLLGHYDQFDKPHPGESSAQPVQAFKAADFGTTLAQQLTRQGLWEARWKIESAFDECVESILSDDILDGAGKLTMLGESCAQYAQALGDWAARVIAVSGKAAGEPSEVKAGRRLSAASTAKIRAALAALSDLLGEPASYDSEPPAKDEEKSTVETETAAPGPDDTQVADDPPSAKAGPGTEPPTAGQAVGTDVAPPTSNEQEPLDPIIRLDRDMAEVKTLLGWR
jgi:HK97 family phage prohead protease